MDPPNGWYMYLSPHRWYMFSSFNVDICSLPQRWYVSFLHRWYMNPSTKVETYVLPQCWYMCSSLTVDSCVLPPLLIHVSFPHRRYMYPYPTVDTCFLSPPSIHVSFPHRWYMFPPPRRYMYPSPTVDSYVLPPLLIRVSIPYGWYICPSPTDDSCILSHRWYMSPSPTTDTCFLLPPLIHVSFPHRWYMFPSPTVDTCVFPPPLIHLSSPHFKSNFSSHLCFCSLYSFYFDVWINCYIIVCHFAFWLHRLLNKSLVFFFKFWFVNQKRSRCKCEVYSNLYIWWIVVARLSCFQRVTLSINRMIKI